MPTQNLMAATSALPQVLVAQSLAASETTQYTGPANSSTKLASATLTNSSATQCTVSLSLVKSGGTASSANRVVSAYTIQPGDSVTIDELHGVFLGPGDFISAIASPNIQTLTTTGSPSGGTFTMSYAGSPASAAAAYNAAVSTVQAYFNALSTVPGLAIGSGSTGAWTLALPGVATLISVTPSFTGGSSPGITVAAVPQVVLAMSGVVFS